MVGLYIGLETKSLLHLRHRKVFFNLNRRLEESADELNIPLTVYDKLFGSKADHKSFRPFAKKTRFSFQRRSFIPKRILNLSILLKILPINVTLKN